MLRTLGFTAALSLVAITTFTAPAEAAYRVTTPDGLHAIRATATTMTLDWRSVDRASAYKVQVSASPHMTHARYYRFGTSTGTVRSLTPERRYYFRVSALGGAASTARVSRYTAPSYPSTVTPAVAAPTDLAAVAKTAASVSLTWKAPEGASRFRVSTSTTPDFAAPIRMNSIRPTATVRGLDSGKPYYFKVRAIRPDGTGLTRFSAPVTAATETPTPTEPEPPVVDGPSDVRVGSYNVQSVSLDATAGEQRPWAQRRAGVLANILGEDLDVIGLQEANHGTSFAPRLVDGTTQFLDIRNGLDAAGQNFEVTNENSANCVNATTTYNCVPQNRGVAGSDRILYNADRIAMVSQGGYAYPTQDAAGTPRNLAYAVLRVKRTGDEFLFASTHLEAHSRSVRHDQWLELIAKLRQLRGSLPVIAVGDFNVQKFDAMAAEMLPAMKNAGIGDVLNQEYAVNPSRNVRAQRLVNGWVNTYNHLSRDIEPYSYADRRDKTGNNIDWIFATNSLVVKEWKVVLDYDPRTLTFRGVIPSDHNMVRATITLP